MNRTTVCPHCRVLNLLSVAVCGPPEVVCTYCGRPIPAGAPPATVLCIDDDPLVLRFYRGLRDSPVHERNAPM
jgi:hypothetical protein